MVGRIEIALAGLLGVALLLGLSNQKEILRAKAEVGRERKSVELLDARTREVNASGVVNEFGASRAVLIGKTWYLDRFTLRNADVRSLRAERARRDDREIRLEGNVTLRRYDDAIYRAREVVYDTRGKILRSVGPFTGSRAGDFVRGVNFVYELGPRRTTAEKVFARYRLAEGTRRLR